MSDKSNIAAILFSLSMLHRFYVGRPISGVIFFLTGGGFLIWALIDWVFLLTGNFKDKDGNKLKWSNPFSKENYDSPNKVVNFGPATFFSRFGSTAIDFMICSILSLIILTSYLQVRSILYVDRIFKEIILSEEYNNRIITDKSRLVAFSKSKPRVADVNKFFRRGKIDQSKVGHLKKGDYIKFMSDKSLSSYVEIHDIKNINKTLDDILTIDYSVRMGVVLSILTFLLFILSQLILPATPMRGTIGKRIMRIYVVKNSGARISIIRCLIRGSIALITTPIFLFSHLIMLFNVEKKALHDMIARTKVVAK